MDGDIITSIVLGEHDISSIDALDVNRLVLSILFLFTSMVILIVQQNLVVLTLNISHNLYSNVFPSSKNRLILLVTEFLTND